MKTFIFLFFAILSTQSQAYIYQKFNRDIGTASSHTYETEMNISRHGENHSYFLNNYRESLRCLLIVTRVAEGIEIEFQTLFSEFREPIRAGRNPYFAFSKLLPKRDSTDILVFRNKGNNGVHIIPDVWTPSIERVVAKGWLSVDRHGEMRFRSKSWHRPLAVLPFRTNRLEYSCHF